ncbi:MAG: hypothetical protein RLZZ417_1077 [Bacteroidota bacterium]|jgi:hypothetical protein
MNIQKKIRALWRPEMYHGWGKSTSYFEGWYIKMIDSTRSHAYAVIPGISLGDNGENHAFIQVLDGIAKKSYYYKFPTSDFQPDAYDFSLKLGNNFFSKDEVILDLPILKGHIQFKNRVTWPSSFFSPGVMGWYSFVPLMECYHGVLSMNHDLIGSLQRIDKNEDISFHEGLGYMEKDWGKSFPSWWIWMQSNHFSKNKTASVMVSVARIPFLGSHFNGFLGGWYFEGKWYRFTTYTGAKLKTKIVGESIHITLSDKVYRLEIQAKHEPGAGELKSPIKGEMTGKVNESLLGILQVSFFQGDKCLFQDTAEMAGVEVAGDVPDELII